MFIEGAIPYHLIEQLQSGNKRSGAVCSFLGVVRADEHNGNSVESIEFSAHKGIADEVAKQIATETVRSYKVSEVHILHSTGNVKCGEVCFVVIVVSGHRAEAFAALPYVVDAVKKRCPIFGKEILSGGGHKWKVNK